MTRQEFAFGIYEISIAHIRIFSLESGGILWKWPPANQFHDSRSISPLFRRNSSVPQSRAGDPEIKMSGFFLIEKVNGIAFYRPDEMDGTIADAADEGVSLDRKVDMMTRIT